jgi:hypothetical protein
LTGSKAKGGVTISEDIDDEIARLEEELAGMDDPSTPVRGSPEAPKKDSILVFFRDLISQQDSKKIGNLDKTELNIVRETINIADYAEIEGLDRVAKFLRKEAELYLATSLSKKGFLVQASVTQIKKEQKIKNTDDIKKKSWFSSKKPEESSE